MTGHRSIYGKIAASYGSTVARLKAEAVAWICAPDLRDVRHLDLYDWFSRKFPLLNQVMNRRRPNNGISGMMMELEASIFLGASRKLKKAGIQCITKHDALFFPVDSEAVAEVVLRELFARKGVPFTGKKCSPIIMDSKESFEHLRTGFCMDNGPKMPKNVEIIPNCMEAPGVSEVLGLKSTYSVALSAQNHEAKKATRQRAGKIQKRPDGRWVFTVKKKRHYSKKGETMEDFRNRLAGMGIDAK